MDLKKNQVVEITYKCRDIGYGIEEGTIEGFWTGETDSWGKLTIRPVGSSGPYGETLPFYLFPDEIIDVEEL